MAKYCECDKPVKKVASKLCRECGRILPIYRPPGDRSMVVQSAAEKRETTNAEIEAELEEAKTFADSDRRRRLLRALPCSRYTVDELMYLIGIRRDHLADFENTATDIAGREAECLGEIERRLKLRDPLRPFEEIMTRPNVEMARELLPVLKKTNVQPHDNDDRGMGMSNS